MPRYPAIEPYETGMLDVGEGHRIYWEACGNPAGKPAVVLHGGPGMGCSPGQRRLFDPERYRVVLFDQRNCGRSKPHAADPGTSLSTNTTPHLVADIERLRDHLGIERWLVCGGSWGTTLAFAYAERFPQRVSELVLVAITDTTRAEIDWLYGGVGMFFPEEWQRYRAMVAAGKHATGTELAAAYDVLLQDDDLAARERAAIEWCAWEDAVLGREADSTANWDGLPEQLAFARLCAHYFSHAGFLEDGEIIRNCASLAGIPGVLIHARLDLTTPLVTAWEISRRWPDARLQIIAGRGHASGPEIDHALVTALDGFAVRR